MSEPQFDVTGIGLNATDTVFRVPHFPAYGGKVPFADEHYSVGGQMASAIVTCAKLGLRSKYIGAVGDDYRGQLQIESLEESGVNIDHVRRRTNCPNQSAYIVIDEATGERTVFWNHADCLTLQPDEITPEQILGTRLLHVDCHDTAAVEKAAKIASANGIPVTADVDTLYAGFDRVLPFIDYLVASSEFPARLTGIEDPFKALSAIQERHGMRVAAMTLGAHGSLALIEGRFVYSPAFVVNCLDTTGAGDVFHGAFCYAILQEMPIADALGFSNAMAALNCTKMGARGGIATLEEADALLARGERRSRTDIVSRSSSK